MSEFDVFSENYIFTLLKKSAGQGLNQQDIISLMRLSCGCKDSLLDWNGEGFRF